MAEEDPNRVEGRLALITGASGGIGATTAHHLASLGLHLALAYSSNTTAIQALEAELRKEYPLLVISIHKCDLSSPTETTFLCPAVITAHRGRPIDVFICNAGYGKRIREISDIPPDEYDTMLTINLRAPFLLTKAVVPSMRAQRWGRIIYISSIAASGGGLNGPHYAASKAGVGGLMRNLATQLAGEGVSVNEVCPAMVGGTGMMGGVEQQEEVRRTVPMGRLCEGREVARCVGMFVRVGFATGQSLGVAGGLK